MIDCSEKSSGVAVQLPMNNIKINDSTILHPRDKTKICRFTPLLPNFIIYVKSNSYR
jgi:hypothetical protein